MGERDSEGQMELPLELWEPVPPPAWADAVLSETEGCQDSGWWEA